jgi:hypothetical protein
MVRRMILPLLMLLTAFSLFSLRNASHSNERETRERMEKAVRKAAIGTLVSNSANDVTNLCHALDSLRHLPDASFQTPADMLVFHDGLSDTQQEYLRSCTNRTIKFPHIGYSFESSFPKDFNPQEEAPNWTKRSKWSYQQMIRFWITQVWNHSALNGYTTLMRLDSDACWKKRYFQHGFSMVPTLSAHKVYHSNVQKEDFLCGGFRDFVIQYVKKHDIVPKNERLYRRALEKDCPCFYNNFEIARISFMQQANVVQWHEALTEAEPFGVFRQRWGDAMERFVTMALFATPDMIEETKPRGYQHPCD